MISRSLGENLRSILSRFPIQGAQFFQELPRGNSVFMKLGEISDGFPEIRLFRRRDLEKGLGTPNHQKRLPLFYLGDIGIDILAKFF